MREYKVVHFSEDFSMEDINEAMSSQDEILYFTRYIQEKNEFHIVKHKNGDFKITSFITQLFGFYKKNKNTSSLLDETKVKGNDSFVIIQNVNEQLIERLKNDLNILLKK